MPREKQPKKVSHYELPEGMGFKAGDTVRMKEGVGKQWAILGFSEGRIRLKNLEGMLDVTGEELKEHFERVAPEHPLEELVS